MSDINKQLKGNFAFEGARLSLDNAINHFEAGELLAGKDKFGLAISHIILAAEECAKSMILLIKYNKPRFNFSEMPDAMRETLEKYEYQEIFQKHTPKQKLATIISFFGQFLLQTFPIPISVLDDIIFEDKELSEQELERIKKIKAERQKKINEWLRTNDIPDLNLRENSDWWKGVNNRKNKGLYVDVENGKWKQPSNFTKGDYNKAYKYVSGMIAYQNKSLELQAEVNLYK